MEPRIKREPFPIAISASLLLHVALFNLVVLWLPHRDAPRLPPLRVEYIGDRADSTNTTAPEQVEALAEVTQKANAEQRGVREQAATTPRFATPPPLPLAQPLVKPTPDTAALPLAAVESPEQQADTTTAAPLQKRTTRLALAAPQAAKPVTAPPAAPLPGAELPSLLLSSDLGELARWDRERATEERRNQRQAGEATVDINTREVRYASYFNGIRRRVEQVWVYPRSAKEAGLVGNLLMQFTLNHSGELQEIEILRSSGLEPLDDAAIAAIKKSAPFPPLPEGWGLQRINVKVTFEYLMRH